MMSVYVKTKEPCSAQKHEAPRLKFDADSVAGKSHAKDDALAAPVSDAMAMAIACLGGAKRWTGSVNGFFGLLKRSVVIESFGAVEDGVLILRETLTFDNGDQEERVWRLEDAPEGVMLKADGIEQLRPGRIENGLFVIDYKLVLNGVTFSYQDAFSPGNNGAVSNTGHAKLLGFSVMTVRFTAAPR